MKIDCIICGGRGYTIPRAIYVNGELYAGGEEVACPFILNHYKKLRELLEEPPEQN